MAEKVISLLKQYKGAEYNVLRVSIMGANNCNQHLVIRINNDGEINVVKCPYENLSDVREFLEEKFPTTQIVVR